MWVAAAAAAHGGLRDRSVAHDEIKKEAAKKKKKKEFKVNHFQAQEKNEKMKSTFLVCGRLGRPLFRVCEGREQQEARKNKPPTL